MTLLTDAPAVPAPADEPRTAAPATLPAAPATVVVEVCGDLDLATVARVRERLESAMAARPDRIVVDLSACAFVDASALAMLLEAHRRTCRAGGVLTLRGCSPRVLRLLSLTGLRRVFDLDRPGSTYPPTPSTGSSDSALIGGVTNL